MRVCGRKACSQRAIGPRSRLCAAAAQNDRRHHDVKAVKAVRFEKPRHRAGSALDENAPQPARGEARRIVARLEMLPFSTGKRDALDSLSGGLCALLGDNSRRCDPVIAKARAPLPAARP